LRYKEKAIRLGAQTERPGLAWPVRDLLGGKGLTGRLVSQRFFVGVSNRSR
jgi:hypothetical protein